MSRELRGLEKICRAVGRMRCGDVLWVWDYANEVATPEDNMPEGGERWEQSERARWTTPSLPDGSDNQPAPLSKSKS